jgi:hypothetical protein
MIFLSIVIFTNKEPIHVPEKAVKNNSSNAVQEFYRCIQENLITEDDLSVKFVIELSQQILNRLNRENEDMSTQTNVVDKEEDVTDETSKLLEAISGFNGYEPPEPEVSSIDDEKSTLECCGTYKEEILISEVADVITKITEIIDGDHTSVVDMVASSPNDIFIRSNQIKNYAYNVYKNKGSEIRNTINLYA